VSDTYNYDAHRAHLSGSDSSQNSAQGINYHLDVQVQKDWPGLSPDPNKQRFDVEKMRQAARKIDELISVLDGGGSGTAQSVQRSGAPSFGPESWAAATYLKTAAEQMAGAVGKYTTDLIANLRAASQAIRSAADAYDKTEGANEQTGRNQQAGASQQPSSIS
jgi:cytochrome c556